MCCSGAGDVVVTIAPSAVVLHRHAPDGSARNAIEGTVASIEHLAQRARVRVDGPITIVAEITTAAMQEMGLVPGTHVWCAVKATEIDAQPE